MRSNHKIRLNRLIVCSLFYSASILAFSTAPDDDKSYSPAKWQDSLSARDDAETALQHQDYRLMAFAGRGYDIPGIDIEQSQSYAEKCGTRYFEEFSDVIRNQEQLVQMRKARQYATAYNEVILTSCTLSDKKKPGQ